MNAYSMNASVNSNIRLTIAVWYRLQHIPLPRDLPGEARHPDRGNRYISHRLTLGSQSEIGHLGSRGAIAPPQPRRHHLLFSGNFPATEASEKV